MSDRTDVRELLTHHVALVLDNDEPLYRERQRLVAEALEDEYPRAILRDTLKDLVEGLVYGGLVYGEDDETEQLSMMARELLGVAISCTDFYKLAEGYLDEEPAFQVRDYLEAAREAGAYAAKCAASWTTDGNTDHDAAKRLLQMLEDGYPEADDYLPRRPGLSGEFADDATIGTVAASIGAGHLSGEALDLLADAYEEGVADTFEDACEQELRTFIGEDHS